jgi:hypothetical protein
MAKYKVILQVSLKKPRGTSATNVLGLLNLKKNHQAFFPNENTYHPKPTGPKAEQPAAGI